MGRSSLETKYKGYIYAIEHPPNAYRNQQTVAYLLGLVGLNAEDHRTSNFGKEPTALTALSDFLEEATGVREVRKILPLPRLTEIVNGIDPHATFYEKQHSRPLNEQELDRLSSVVRAKISV